MLLAANNVVINSSVDKQSLPVNDTLTLTLSCDGSTNVPNLNLPALTDFDVIGNSTSTQIQFVNGSQSMTKSFIFSLRPKHKGISKIPSFQFQFQGQVFKTEPITVKVTGFVTPNAQNNPVRRSMMDDFFNDDFFSHFTGRQLVSQRSVSAQQVITEYVPQKSVLYRGEKTMLDFRLYFERGFQQGPVISFPDINGLVSSGKPRQLKNPTPQAIKKNGKNFNVVSDSQWIYGSSAGTKVIPALQIQYVDNPYEGVKTLATQPKTIIINDLPTPEPDSFSGAVGSFSLEARLSPKGILKTNEAIPVIISIKGRGNADMVNTLKLPEVESASWYLDSMDSSGSDGLSVSRKFTYFITLSQAGQVSLAPITFSYFDPENKSYQTLSATIPPFAVEQGSGNASVPMVTSRSSGVNIQQGSVDIRIDKGLLHRTKQVILKSVKYLLGVIVIVALGFVFWRWRSMPLIRLKKQFVQLRQNQKLSNEDFIK